MARKARRHSNTGIYHVMLRGINRQDLFHEESDYLFFLERLHLLAHPPIERISSLPKQDRDLILISVLQKGAGIRQLSKLSAVGFSVIRRLKNVSISPPVIHGIEQIK